MPKAKSFPDIPGEITPAKLAAWCDALDINKAEAAAMIGKAPNYWSRLLAGELDMKLSELNILLQSFRIRKSALERQPRPSRPSAPAPA